MTVSDASGKVLSGDPRKCTLVSGFKMLPLRFKKHNFRLLPIDSDLGFKIGIGSMRVILFAATNLLYM